MTIKKPVLTKRPNRATVLLAIEIYGPPETILNFHKELESAVKKVTDRLVRTKESKKDNVLFSTYAIGPVTGIVPWQIHSEKTN